MKAPADLNLSPQQGEALIERLEHDTLEPEDRRLLVQVLRLYFWLIFALQESKLSVKRLRAIIFGDKSKKPRGKRHSGQGGDSAPSGGGQEADTGGQGESEEAEATSGQAPDSEPESGEPAEEGKRPGHGRLGADAYVGAERVECRHEDLAPGERCPLCGQGTLPCW